MIMQAGWLKVAYIFPWKEVLYSINFEETLLPFIQDAYAKFG